jgi:hypothetical protein
MLFQLPFSPSRRSIPPPAIGTSDCHAHSTTRCKRSFRSGGAHGAAWRGMWGRSGRRSIEREYGTSQHSPADPHSDGNNREGGLCRLPPDSVATPAPAPASAARAAASAGAFLVKRNPSDRRAESASRAASCDNCSPNTTGWTSTQLRGPYLRIKTAAKGQDRTPHSSKFKFRMGTSSRQMRCRLND